MRTYEEHDDLALVGSGLLSQRPVPALLPEQVSRFSVDGLRAKAVRRFDVLEAVTRLRANEGNAVVAVDIGGDKLTASYFVVQDGGVQRTSDVLNRYGRGGEGYLDALLEICALARRDMVPVGISFAGPTDGSRLVAGPNLPVFIKKFGQRYGSDFVNLLPEAEIANDAEAGIMAGALEAVRRYPSARDVIYVINGSGLGGSVLAAGTIYAAEPGHVEVVSQLNIFGQRGPCGLGGAVHVCLEMVAASKAGVEEIWLQQTGEHLPGREIAARYMRGEQLALRLYENSAHATAHAIKGMAVAFQLLSDPGRLVFVCHGGIFHVPGYGEWVRAILGRDLGHVPQILFTKDFSANACLDGAAIAAAVRARRG